MNNLTPSQDQLMAQLRILITTLGGIATTIGISSTSANYWVNMSLALIGPVFIIAGILWSLYTNTRESIMRSAAKPAAPGLAAPQIVLPKAEADLAQKLPENVNTTETKKVLNT